jgi:hypothetical protein
LPILVAEGRRILSNKLLARRLAIEPALQQASWFSVNAACTVTMEVIHGNEPLILKALGNVVVALGVVAGAPNSVVSGSPTMRLQRALVRGKN